MKNKKIITATLLVSDGPVQNSYFEELLEINEKKLFKLFDEINNDLTNLGFGFYLRFDSTKSDLVTVNDIPKYLDSVKPPSVLKGLSTPALETLAIIAYEQPVTKLKVSEIRGVESESSIKTLESRGLVYKSGELDVPGSPILYSTTDEFLEKTKAAQTDKEDNHIVLYAANKDAQHSYIQAAKDKGYEVLILDSPIVSHLMQKLETSNGKIKFTRVDADHIDNLIKKEDTIISKLSDEEKETLKPMIENAVPKETYTVQLESMDSNASPFMITVPEFMRRMKEMSASGGGGMMGMGNLPEMYNLVVNTNHELVGQILQTKTDKKRNRLISQAFDLAKLSQNLLHGEDLTNFIKRSYDMIK